MSKRAREEDVQVSIKRANVGQPIRAIRGPRLPGGGYKAYGRGMRTMPPAGFKKGTEQVSEFYGRYNLPGGGSELKFFDTANSWSVSSTAVVPATGQENLIPQGVTESTRVGRKATVKSIQMRGRFTYVPAADTAGGSNAYLYVVLDKQCNGAAAAITDVLTGNDISTAMINLANSERFVILKRFVCPVFAEAGVQAAFARYTVAIDWYHKCNIPLEFSSTTGAITELKSNNIFFLSGCDSNTNNLIAYTGTCRLRFSDD